MSVTRNLGIKTIKLLRNSFLINRNFFLLFLFQALLGVSAIPNYFVSKPGWIDPWVNIGYGQTWPEKSFDGTYYKESRLINIIFQSLLSNFNSTERLYIQSATASLICVLTGITITRIFSKIGNRNQSLFSGVYSLFIFLNFLNWGDSAGGVDYYNQLGLGLLLIFAYATHRITNYPETRYFYLLGIIVYINTIEVPQSFPLLALITLNLLVRKSNGHLSQIWRRLGFFVFGCSTVVFVESTILFFVGQSPTRLVSGPYYLLSSILNSETLKPWQSEISVTELQRYTHVVFFEVLLLLIFIAILVTSIHKINPPIISPFVKLMFISIALFFVASWIMELNGNSFLIRIDYAFTACLYLVQITYLSLLTKIIEVLNVKPFIQLLLLLLTTLSPLVLIYSFSSHIQYFLWCIFAYVFFILLKNTKSLVLCLILSLISFSSAVLLSNNDARINCLHERILAQQQIFDSAKVIDANGQRGTQTIAIELGDLDQYFFLCGEKIPISDFVYSLSSLGFPGIGKYGDLPTNFFELNNLNENYAASRLVTFENDGRRINRCIFSISLSVDPNTYHLSGTSSFQRLVINTGC